jgi:hypothetical protein
VGTMTLRTSADWTVGRDQGEGAVECAAQGLGVSASLRKDEAALEARQR